MAEAIIVVVFLMLLIFLQIREQQRITLVTKRSRLKQIISLTLAMMVLIIFWPEQLADQVKMIAFAVLICAIGFLKDGLADDHLVKFGVLNGDYQQYIAIQIENLGNGQSFVTFHNRKNNQFSFFFEDTSEVLTSYFKQLGLSDKLIIGELSESKKKAMNTH
ncbi:hypothetical protein A5886_001087 [Enterococcus sp. 8G7_MSG3316]|uniref:DUF5673 domain-containing protein n=1 Tax=Candidatus Enterococcus testudinis TaxID=1834191 RepID=A0A242A5J9_9ENTE|nr:hypothetical protein [Enterococcus sp. 8G7_MSG3316]OTN76011.1 hypothetical protein A5886_001087 [Enterococcus sp. 8G7_MSG3316]